MKIIWGPICAHWYIWDWFKIGFWIVAILLNHVRSRYNKWFRLRIFVRMITVEAEFNEHPAGIIRKFASKTFGNSRNDSFLILLTLLSKTKNVTIKKIILIQILIWEIICRHSIYIYLIAYCSSKCIQIAKVYAVHKLCGITYARTHLWLTIS